MSQSDPEKNIDEIARLQKKVRRLAKSIEQQKGLENQLNETLHSLRVHEEELRTQNEDLLAAQAEITLSQRKYRDLFDFAPIGYFLVDAKGIILEANLTGARMIDRDRNSIHGKPMFLFVEAECRPVFESHLREIWAGYPASAEVVLTKKNKEALPVELFSIPVTDSQGRIGQCRIAATDISKRRKAEASLKESEHRLEAIISTIPDIVYRLDRNGMISFISESIRRYGYLPDELMGKPLLSLVHPEDRKKARHRIDERRTGARSTSGLELRLMPAGKSAPSGNDSRRAEHYFSVNAEGLYTDGEKPANHFIGTQGIAHDISKRKQNEIDKIRLENELNQARKMEAVGTLAGGIAHDFNNLLMGIQGSASLIQLDIQKAVGEQTLQSLENIEQCVQRGRSLTQQLLGFAKSGKYNVKTIDINKMVADTARLFGSTRKTIDIQHDFDTRVWAVDADRGQLEQVVLNLLINADQAMPQGGRVLLKTENVAPDAHQLRHLGLTPGKYVRILVEDTGVGMNQNTQDRIFEPFFTTKEIGRGSGLGMASAYGIIKNHGGTIDVHSASGRGSSFFVYLPASTGAVMTENEKTQGIVKGNGTILLVDDEKIIVDVGSQLLDRLGYRAMVAESGRKAVEIYKQRHDDIDLVILDMIMPEMSGFETYNHLKRINPKIKVLLSSGYSRKGQAGEIVAQDQQDFIQKPFDLARLSRKIARIITRQ